MKFCPNCGFLLEDKKICDCGYNVDTNEIDTQINYEYNKKIKENYERQCGVFQISMKMSQQPIFNKESDIIMEVDYIEQMRQLYKDIEEAKK